MGFDAININIDFCVVIRSDFVRADNPSEKIRMRIFRTLMLNGLSTFLILCGTSADGQTNNNENKNQLTGVWGMFRDKHPDGWGKHNPPSEYLEFMENNGYNRTYLHKKGNGIIFGTYELVNDSLLIFHESIGTDGINKVLVKADTARLFSLKIDLIELWEDWDRTLWKNVKKWGHKKKYRPLTIEEKEKLKVVTTKLMTDYSLIKDTEEKND